jgi:ribosomal protein S27AE
MKYKEAKELLENKQLACPRCWTTSDYDLTISDFDEDEDEETSVFCHKCGKYVL